MSDEDLGRMLLYPYMSSPLYLVELTVSAIVVLIVFGQIAKRAGFSRLWSLTLLLPVIGGFMPVLFAMVPWPVERQKRKPAKKRKRKS